MPAHVQDDIDILVEFQTYESAKEKILLQKLKAFAVSLFTREHEECLVRLLCVHLDYLQPSTPMDILDAAPNIAMCAEFEGNRGSLELLHPCGEDPTSQNIRRCSYQMPDLIDTVSPFF